METEKDSQLSEDAQLASTNYDSGYAAAAAFITDQGDQDKSWWDGFADGLLENAPHGSEKTECRPWRVD